MPLSLGPFGPFIVSRGTFMMSPLFLLVPPEARTGFLGIGSLRVEAFHLG